MAGRIEYQTMNRFPIFILQTLVILTSSMWPATLLAAPPVALYEVTKEIGMPHLEEILRYTITHERRCLSRDGLHRLFPILQHPALAGCYLGAPAISSAHEVTYPLLCDGNHGTTGVARWEAGYRRLTGTLAVKLGGKNMTFFQRVTAIALGGCKASTP